MTLSSGSEIRLIVAQALADALDFDLQHFPVEADTALTGLPGFSSLGLVRALSFLEERLNRELDDEQLFTVRTVGEVYAYFEQAPDRPSQEMVE